jgi:CHAT domain-containing protein
MLLGPACFKRNASQHECETTHSNSRSVDSREEAYQYGGRAVERIGTILKSPNTTFIGPTATLSNFNAHISNSDLLHIHLHTNYGASSVDNPQQPPKPGLLSSTTPSDTTFTTSPLSQAIIFNSPSPPPGELSVRHILTLELSRGAHLNLVGCASGRQGKFNVPNVVPMFYNITDEVMGLVPAFLFAGAGSVTSTLWPIQDEHGAVFSCHLFGELMKAREGRVDVRREGKGEKGKGKEVGRGSGGWVDLAEVHREAVLEMRRIYKQPSAWAGFVLSGYWRFRPG